MKRQVSEDELVEMGVAVRFILPGAAWETDNEGQLVIYTNLFQISEDQIVEGD